MPREKSMSDRIPMTQVGYAKIKAELEHLQAVELPKILERIATARAEGDLSENAEYQYSQESRMLMEAKINSIRDKIARAIIMETSSQNQDSVAFGATVTVKDLDFGDTEEYTLVGAGEEDYDTGKINITSPLAQGLVTKKVGDTVEIPVPKGTLKYEIMEIRYEG